MQCLFGDGQRIVFLSFEPRRDGPGRPFAQYYSQTPTHIWIHDLKSGALEEICAKTLYNMSGHIKGREFPYPFDDDAPFWVLPIAVGFARALGIPDPCSISSLLRPQEGA